MTITMKEVKRKHPEALCEQCPLAQKDCAPSVIPAKPVAALVARSPGYHEAKTGVPFSGPSGKIVDFLLNEQGVKRAEVLLTNVVLCMPDEGKVPTEAIKACSPRLNAELDGVELVIAGGSEAVNLLIGKGSIDKYRGYRHERNGRTYVATNNPFLVIRDDSAFPNLRKDFRRAFNPIPEPVLPTVKVFEDVNEAKRLVSYLRDTPGYIAADIESRGGLTHKATLISMQFAVAEDEAFVLGERGGIFTDRDFIEDFLRPLLESRNHHWIWHNGKFDTKVLRHTYGINARVDEDSMLASYACPVVGTKIAMRDLTWKSVEDLSVGEELIGFQNLEEGDKPTSFMKVSVVESVKRFKTECLEVITEKGSIIVSKDHRFPINRAGSNSLKWMETSLIQDRLEQSKKGSNRKAQFRIPFFGKPWEIDESRMGGYIAGILDGEGHIQSASRYSRSYVHYLGFSQNSGRVLSTTIKYLGNLGFEGSLRQKKNSNCNVYTFSGKYNTLRAIGMFRPERFIHDTDYLWEGPKKHHPTLILDIKDAGIQEVVAVKTTTGTFITDGYLSHNCDERSGAAAKEQGGIHKLENLLAEEFGWPKYEDEEIEKIKKTGIVTDYDKFYRYGGMDAAGTLQLHNHFARQMDKEQVAEMYRRLLLEGFSAIIPMELAGFRYDIDSASDLMEETVKPEIIQKTQNLRNLIDDTLYNPRSPVRTAALFYDTWKINHEMRTRPDKNRSTDDAALGEILAGRFTHKAGDLKTIMSFARELKRFRELTKQADTYITGMIEQAIKDDEQRIYTDLLLHGTTTGRPASRNPNLLNITRTKEGLPDIRKLFLPSNGRLLVVADYSQAELRTIAYLSQDEQLLKVYNEGLDLHSFSAERFYGPNFTPENRSIAKNINFGVFYGQSADSFQEKHGIDKVRAQAYIDWCWKNYTGVARWKDDVIKQMRTGRVVTPFGRVRRFHLLTKENFNASVREAVNFLPQSIAADFTLLGVIRLGGGLTVHPEIDTRRASLVLTVYDSIIGDVEESYVDEYKTICKQVMESIPKEKLGWTIPYVVDIGAGETWAATK